MADYAKLRARLAEKIRESKNKQLDMLAKDSSEQCKHDWHRHKKSITQLQPDFSGMRAYFIVAACYKCKTIKNMDYKVE